MTARLATALQDRYAIERKIGAGGMATVYLARDLKHNRHVALKVLNAELGAVLGVDRFLAEIQVTAHLQHPHLLPLFDSGEAAGLLFYVMPYVEGESLRQRIDREKQLPIEEAVRIAAAVASALDYAHRQNVVHRDLKPENILLHDGQPVVADFGIALAVSNAGGTRITQTGLSLGTPQYMSPEQGTGDRDLDGRTDIYSLAAVTYEMLAGEPPHLGHTVQAILAKVLTEKAVSIRVRRPTVPEHVAAAIDKALEKTPADRFATAHDFADAITGKRTVAAPLPYRTRGPEQRVRPAVSRRELVAWGLVLFAGVGLWWQSRPTAITEAPVVRAIFDLPPGLRVSDARQGTTVAVSPRGELIAFTATGPAGARTLIRRTSELTAREVADVTVGGSNLSFSPDGRWLAFSEGNEIKKVSVDGGPVITIGRVPALPAGLSWIGTDTIVSGSGAGLYMLTGAGGSARPFQHADSIPEQIGQRWPIAVPGSDAVLYASGNSTTSDGLLAVRRVGTGGLMVFDVPIAVPLALLDGQLVYLTHGGTLLAIPFDVGSLRPTGDPVSLEEGVVVDVSSGAKAALSASGTLVFLRGRPQVQPVLVGEGSALVTPLIGEPNQYATPRFSPDGRRVAITMQGANSVDIGIYDIANHTMSRLTSDGVSVRPEWTPDGSRVVFRSERAGKAGIWWQRADGSAPAELLYDPDVDPYEALVSPDNKWIVYRTTPGAKFSRDIFVVPITRDRKPVALASGPAAELMPSVSPDSRWLAYASNDLGRMEIYVLPFPGGGARVQVSDGGGNEPMWDPSGRMLYYRAPSGNLIGVSVTTGATLSIGARRTVVTGDYLTDLSHPSYDIAPDGRFLLLKRTGAESQIIVVHNWGRELRAMTGKRQ